jgi:hypothetical protein
MLIGFVFLAGCEKDPNNNNTTSNTPVLQEDLSLSSYIALNGDTFRGAYNSKIEDTIIVYEKQMPIHDRQGKLHSGYSYINYMKILFYGSNKDGSRPKDTIFRVSFIKGFVDTVKLNLEKMPMDFEDAAVRNDQLGISDDILRGSNSSIYMNWLGMKWFVGSVHIYGNWGFRRQNQWDDSTMDYLNPDTRTEFRKTSLKTKKLVDGKIHRVFESEYHSSILSNNPLMIPKPVKVRIVLD